MSNTTPGKRPITPKQQRIRSQIQPRSHHQEDVYVRTSLPPLVEGSVHAILICQIPKLRWNKQHQGVCQSVHVRVSWWGEEETWALFKPQVTQATFSPSQKFSTTAKYYIRSELKQFNRYLKDAADLVLKIIDSETNRYIGTAKVQNLSSLSISTPITGYQSIFTNKGDKLGEVFVSLRLILPGTRSSNENLSTSSVASDINNPLLRDDKVYRKLERARSEDDIGSVYLNNQSTKPTRFDSTGPFGCCSPSSTKTPSGQQRHANNVTDNVVEELIVRGHRLREEMIRSTSPTTIPANNNCSSGVTQTAQDQSLPIDLLHDHADSILNSENICDMLGIKPNGDLNNSNESILSDLEGLENEQSLLDDLLYGDGHKREGYNKNNNNYDSMIPIQKRHPRGKPPTGRSPSPSIIRVCGSSNRPRSAKSRASAQSSDSDTASRVSFDMPSSDLDDSENETHDDDSLCPERIQLLNYVRIARVRIDQLRLQMLNTDRESPSHSSFGRTNKSKRAGSYFIEYQFPVIANSRDGQKDEATQVMKIASKRFELNNDIIFSHLAAYPCLLNESTLKNWWRSLLIFKVFNRFTGTSSPEQIGFAVLPLRNVLKADSLYLDEHLSVIDRTKMNQQKLSNKMSKKLAIGQLHVVIELDSDVKNFKLELDRVRLIEQSKPKKKLTSKTKKKKKKSKQVIVNPNDDDLRLPKAFLSEGFILNESISEPGDEFVIQTYLSIVEARINVPPSNNSPRNPYFVCRAFWNEEPITSIVCWGSSSPIFNFEQKTPLLLTKSTVEKMHNNFLVIEIWDRKISGSTDKIIGIVKVSLEQFYKSFKDKKIRQVLLQAQYPAISVDSCVPIIDPFTTTKRSLGELRLLLAMGTADQIAGIKMTNKINASTNSITHQSPAISTESDQSTLIEHCFEILIEGINGLRAFTSLVSGDSECFIQYSFPIQREQTSFELRTIRTATILCTVDPTFHDINKFRYVLSSNDVLHKYFYAACQTSSQIETCIPFEVWIRFYHPNIRDQLLAKGRLPASKLCSMTSTLRSDEDNKTNESFRVPLEVIRDNSIDGQYPHVASTPMHEGYLSVTVTYKRNLVKRDERLAICDRLAHRSSQVCISVGIIRACGLRHATMSQARHDNRLGYPSQIGVNTFAKLSLSFLSESECRITRTIARSFIPEFNHSVDFPVPLIWNEKRNQTVSLAEMLEHGELKIDIYHQMGSTTDANQYADKRPMDIHLCYCTISLRDLLLRHTGIKGWYPLVSVNRTVTSEIASDPSEHCVGGLELSVRFGQQNDRSRVIDSAKALGWPADDYAGEETFLDDQKDLGCLLTLFINRVQFPIQLATRPGKDCIDDRTSVFVQYRLYDKEAVITKRKKPIVDQNNVICDLKFTKDHLFLCNAPFLWYLREEKLEMQIWTSENDSYDHSQLLPSTDRHIGSIYLDLSSLCDKRRKSHRLNAILPMFKQAAKDLGGGFVQVHVTIDKSKDFNELRTRSDIEHHPYQDNLNTNNDTQYVFQQATEDVFTTVVNVEQAAHLPKIYSKQQNAHIQPNACVTYSTAQSHHLYCTPVVKSTNKPVWNDQRAVKLAVEHLIDDKRSFILKVWHKDIVDGGAISERSGDKIIGTVSIDLSPLLSGLKVLSGWYDIMDALGNSQGQLKISVVPQDDVSELKRFKQSTSRTTTGAHSSRSTSTISGYSTSRISTDRPSSNNFGYSIGFTLPRADSNNDNRSPLMSNLHRHLDELGKITEGLRARLHSGSDFNSISSRPIPSTAQENRCQSVPLPSTIIQNQQDMDSARSAATTIKTGSSEHAAEVPKDYPFNIQEPTIQEHHLRRTSNDDSHQSSVASTPPIPISSDTHLTNESAIRPDSTAVPFHDSTKQEEPLVDNATVVPTSTVQPIESSVPLKQEDTSSSENGTTIHTTPRQSPLHPHSQQQSDENLSNEVIIRHNIFSTQPMANDQELRSLSPSTSSSSSTTTTTTQRQASITGGTPTVDQNPLKHEYTNDNVKDRVSPLPPFDQFGTQRPPSRSSHLAFLSGPKPQFFPPTRDIEKNIQHRLHELSTPSTSTVTTDSTESFPHNVTHDRIQQLLKKPTKDILHGISPIDHTAHSSSDSPDIITVNIPRLEKIFKTKRTTTPLSN